MIWSPAHHAVEMEDLAQLRDLLDSGADIEEETVNGMTLLLHAIDIEIDGATQTGQPLRVDMTAFLLARGANPHIGCRAKDALLEAHSRGHWLAVELIQAWHNQSKPPPPLAPRAWFAVRCIFQTVRNGGHSYEERITLWLAESLDGAIVLAEQEAAEYVESQQNCRYVGLAQAYELVDPPSDGAEVFSLIRDSALSSADYLDRYFDTGTEHQQQT